MFDTYLSVLSGFPGFLLALIGFFYMFAGFVLAHHVAVDRVLSRAIEMISLEKQSRAETLQQAWTIVSAVLIFAGGAALLFLSSLAVWLFVVALVQQVAYLTFAAPKYFDRHDEPDPVGRRQSTNATILYGAATLAVIAAASSGALLPVTGEGAWSVAAASALTAVFAVWTIARMRMPARQGGALAPFANDHDEIKPVDLNEVTGVRLAAGWFELPVHVSFADGEADYFSPGELYLEDALSRDLEDWQQAFKSACDIAGDEMAPSWTEDERKAHYARASELAARIRLDLRDKGQKGIEVSWMREDGEIVIVD